MKERFPEALVKAVKEYYEWHGDKSPRLVRTIKNKHSDFTMLLVRFTDAHGDKNSALMYHSSWADGHYDVTEDESALFENERELIEAFENSEDYV